jgi:hypothetical protein
MGYAALKSETIPGRPNPLRQSRIRTGALAIDALLRQGDALFNSKSYNESHHRLLKRCAAVQATPVQKQSTIPNWHQSVSARQFWCCTSSLSTSKSHSASSPYVQEAIFMSGKSAFAQRI